MYRVVSKQLLLERSTKVLHPDVEVDSTTVVCGICDINACGGPLSRMASTQRGSPAGGVIA